MGWACSSVLMVLKQMLDWRPWGLLQLTLFFDMTLLRSFNSSWSPILNSVPCLFLLPFTYWSTSLSPIRVFIITWDTKELDPDVAGIWLWGWVGGWYYSCLCSWKDHTSMKFISGIKLLPWRTALGASSFIDVQSWMCILRESFSKCKT